MKRLNLFCTGFQKQHQIVEPCGPGRKNSRRSSAYVYSNKFYFCALNRQGVEFCPNALTLTISDVPGGASNNPSTWRRGRRPYPPSNPRSFFFPAAPCARLTLIILPAAETALAVCKRVLSLSVRRNAPCGRPIAIQGLCFSSVALLIKRTSTRREARLRSPAAWTLRAAYTPCRNFALAMWLS